MRDRIWGLLDNVVDPGATVAIVGAGNADDLPLTRLATRARRVDLVDIDGAALAGARRREPRGLRRRLRRIEQDVTGGAADRILRAALRHRQPPQALAPPGPIGDGGYDLVIGDLFYTQLLYPALADACLDSSWRSRVLERCGQALTDSVVARLHRSTASGVVLHLHDVAGWWRANPQPIALERVLAAGPLRERSMALVRPQACDPELSLERAGIPVVRREIWRWPFSPDVDYLVAGLLTHNPPNPPTTEGATSDQATRHVHPRAESREG